jgi:hypothetical protein
MSDSTEGASAVDAALIEFSRSVDRWSGICADNLSNGISAAGDSESLCVWSPSSVDAAQQSIHCARVFMAGYFDSSDRPQRLVSDALYECHRALALIRYMP